MMNLHSKAFISIQQEQAT